MKNDRTVAMLEIGSNILTIRGLKVIIDWDLAEIYGVKAKMSRSGETRKDFLKILFSS